jgi:hypothetical protein
VITGQEKYLADHPDLAQKQMQMQQLYADHNAQIRAMLAEFVDKIKASLIELNIPDEAIGIALILNVQVITIDIARHLMEITGAGNTGPDATEAFFRMCAMHAHMDYAEQVKRDQRPKQ